MILYDRKVSPMAMTCYNPLRHKELRQPPRQPPIARPPIITIPTWNFLAEIIWWLGEFEVIGWIFESEVCT